MISGLGKSAVDGLHAFIRQFAGPALVMIAIIGIGGMILLACGRPPRLQPLVVFKVRDSEAGQSIEASLSIDVATNRFRSNVLSSEPDRSELEKAIIASFADNPFTRGPIFEAFLSWPSQSRVPGAPLGQTLPATWKWSFELPRDTSGVVRVSYVVFERSGESSTYLGEGSALVGPPGTSNAWWEPLGRAMKTFWPIVSGIVVVVGAAVAVRLIQGPRSTLLVTGSHGRMGQNPSLGPGAGWLVKGGDAGSDETVGEEIVTVRAVNTGDRTVTVENFGIEMRGGQRALLTGNMPHLPHSLRPGEVFIAWGRASSLRRRFSGSEPAYPYSVDAEGNTHRGKFDEYFASWLQGS